MSLGVQDLHAAFRDVNTSQGESDDAAQVAIKAAGIDPGDLRLWAEAAVLVLIDIWQEQYPEASTRTIAEVAYMEGVLVGIRAGRAHAASLLEEMKEEDE